MPSTATTMLIAPPATANGRPQGGDRYPTPPIPTSAGHDPDSYRRNVAILFADITDFTRLTETVEPEIVYHTVTPLLDDLVACVHQHGGEVQQVLGDGFMAAFGLHPMDGDVAQQAVHAGRAMLPSHDRNSTRLDIHIGIEYGEVLVTRPRQPASFSVWGRAVNLAQRLCQAAAPGQLVIGPALYNKCRHRPAAAATMHLRLHGITRPVNAYRIAPS
jgi:class 3 adenylate cyclase